MDLLSFLRQSPALQDSVQAKHFAKFWDMRRVLKGSRIATQGTPDMAEIIVLDGAAASLIGDAEGRTACVGLYHGPCIVTPNIARTRDGVSLVTIEAQTDTLIATMDADALSQEMLSNLQVRDWANGVLRAALAQKADREWCLAALGGAQRLAWLRENFPTLEAVFGHALIASHLGITPVTLSRLRQAAKE